MTLEIGIQKPLVYDLTRFNAIISEHQDRVYNQAYRILGESKTAEDIMQDTFLNAYLKFHTYKGGSIKAWLLRIVTNLCFSELRRRKHRREVSLEPFDIFDDEIESPNWLKSPCETPEEVMERNDQVVAIQQSICKLHVNHRIVLVLVDIQGLNYKEAASVIGCPVGTVKSRLARSRMRLRSDLRNVL